MTTGLNFLDNSLRILSRLIVGNYGLKYREVGIQTIQGVCFEHLRVAVKK